jgi:predicted transcriptional regulator
MSKSAVRPTTIKLDEDIKKRIKRLAEARRRSTHWMILDAIHQYVDREEKREVFREDGTRAWNEYRASGLHVTFEEADAWLAKLEAGQDEDMPECHR